MDVTLPKSNSLDNIKGMKLVHFNIHSLPGKFVSLKIKTNISIIDVLTICESWLNGFQDAKTISLIASNLTERLWIARKGG